MNAMPTASAVSRLENDSISVEFLNQAGPRIVGLYVKGSDLNLMGTAPSLGIDTPYGMFNGVGGHRLWHSPEAMPRTYVPDNEGLTVEQAHGRVSLVGPVEPFAAIQKTITIELPDHGCQLTLRHRLENQGAWPIEVAPWAITMLPMGGVAVLPDQPADTVKNALLPDRVWALWPYSDLQDDRFEAHNDLILLRANPKENPFKIGYANKLGWVGYYFKGCLLVKRFAPQLASPHPDFGCNTESYVRNEFIEVETLGALARLEPGQSTEFVEDWQIYPDLDAPPTIEGLRTIIQQLGLKTSLKG